MASLTQQKADARQAIRDFYTWYLAHKVKDYKSFAFALVCAISNHRTTRELRAWHDRCLKLAPDYRENGGPK